MKCGEPLRPVFGGREYSVSFSFPPPKQCREQEMAFKLKSLPLPYSLYSSPRQNPNFMLSNHRLPRRFAAHSLPLSLCLSSTASASTFHRTAFVTARAFQSDELINEGEEDRDEEMPRQGEKKELANQGIWRQMKDIVMFTGPATGLWICAPLMSLIDTAVIGQRSSIELAALGIETDQSSLNPHY